MTPTDVHDKKLNVSPPSDNPIKSRLEATKDCLEERSAGEHKGRRRAMYSNLSVSRRLFGKAPWHKQDRKGSGDSSSTKKSSAASSVLEILRGHTPPASPVHAKYDTGRRGTWESSHSSRISIHMITDVESQQANQRAWSLGQQR